jgi:putative tryptophan/tyrosine transport system substrate-binding protein
VRQPAKVSRVGVLTPAENDATPVFDGFRTGLRDLGYVEGKTIVLDFRVARGNLDALAGLAAELIRIPVDVILADATNAARVAFDATRTIPIVVGAMGHPVGAGLVMVPCRTRPRTSIQGFILLDLCEPVHCAAGARGVRAL